MNEENAIISYGKNLLKAYVEQNPFSNALIKTVDDTKQNFIIERLKKLENKIEDLEFFEKQISYLMNDQNKYIHVRNFLSFYFTKTDPSLVETNIKIFLDYVKEKYNHNSYDILLEKICLLNKESLNVLQKIKTNISENNYYEWEDFIKLYPNVDSNLKYRELLTSKELNYDMLEVSFGIKNLIENDFIISLSTNYPGSIDVYNVDKFSLTNIGFLILNYI